MNIITPRDRNLYQDSALTIYFGDARDKLYQDYYLNLPDQPILQLNPFNNIAQQFALNDLVFLKQIHSVDGQHITQSMRSFTQEGDYLITQQPIALGVMTADCLPIVIYDSKHHAAAMIHAGWRGAVQQIACKAVEHMRRTFNAQLSDLKFFFGPAARSCCYQVGDDFYKNIEQFPYGHQALCKRENSIYFDLPLFNRLQLETAGISVAAIDQTYLNCTMCDDRFFSHRRQGKMAGRQMTIVALK